MVMIIGCCLLFFRCWITITSAIENKLGAAPAGPAGTGKTESTKDLAKSLGRLCIVFNCSDQITAAMMNKLYSGLVQQGKKDLIH